MSAQHTPGPWFVVRYGDGESLVICTDEAGDHRIAFMAVPGCRDQTKRARAWKEIAANACLLGAAPDLLEAARVGLNSLEDELSCLLEAGCLLDDDGKPIRSTIDSVFEDNARALEEKIAQVRAAIAKAEGRS